MASAIGVSRTRLRQIALVAKDLEKAKHILVCSRLEETLTSL